MNKSQVLSQGFSRKDENSVTFYRPHEPLKLLVAGVHLELAPRVMIVARDHVGALNTAKGQSAIADDEARLQGLSKQNNCKI